MNVIGIEQIEKFLKLAQEESDSIVAYNYAVNAKLLSQNNNIPELIAESQLVLADMFIKNGAYDKALKESGSALIYFSKTKNHIKEEKCWRITAVIYGFLANYKKQLKYNLKCLDLLSKIDNPNEELQIKNNIGNTYLNLEKLEKAINIFFANLNDSRANKHMKCLSLKNIAKTYFIKQKYDLSKQYFLQTLELAVKIRNIEFQAATHFFLGKLFFQEWKLDTSLFHIKRANKLSLKLGNFVSERKQIIELLIQLQLELGHTEKAIISFNLCKKLNKEINDRFLDKSIKTTQFKFEINEIEKERKLLSQQNKLLKAANIKIEQQKADLEIQSKLLAITNADLKSFAHTIAHDLKQPIRTVNNFVNLLEIDLKGKLDDQSVQFMNFIKSATSEMTTFVSDVLKNAEIGVNKEPIVIVDSNNIIEKIKLNLDSQLKETNGEITYENLPYIQCHSVSMIQIFQNIISNAIKFHRPNVPPKINVTGYKNDYCTVFEIQDNGIGIKDEDKEKVFQLFKRLNSKSDYEGSGIGLSTVLKLINKYNGKIEIESKVNQGTKFILSFPYIS